MCSTLFISFLSEYEKAISSTKAREHICNLSPLSRTNGRGKNHFPLFWERSEWKCIWKVRGRREWRWGRTDGKGGTISARFFTQVKPYFTSGCCNTSSVGSQRETDTNEEGREVKKQGANENKGPNPRLWKLWHRGSVCTPCLANNLESCKMWMRESSKLIISHPWGRGDECELKEDSSTLAVPQAVTHQSGEAKTTDSWNKKEVWISHQTHTERCNRVTVTYRKAHTNFIQRPQCDKRIHLNLWISIPRALIRAF